MLKSFLSCITHIKIVNLFGVCNKLREKAIGVRSFSFAMIKHRTPMYEMLHTHLIELLLR